LNLFGKVHDLSDILKIFRNPANNVIAIAAFLILSGIVFIQCSNPAKNDNPMLSNLLAPDSLQKGFAGYFYVFVTASDPQGLNDISSVYCTVTRPDDTLRGPYSLYDDGANGGDSVAGDGIYTAGFLTPDTSNLSGNYTFGFTAQDNDGLKSNTIDKIIKAYDSPIIVQPYGNFYDPEWRHLLVKAKITPKQAPTTIDTAWIELTFQDSGRYIGSYMLHDDGQNGDTTAADTYFSADILSPDSVFSGGAYLLKFMARDSDGHLSLPTQRIVFLE
jgi:hypothetical protein